MYGWKGTNTSKQLKLPRIEFGVGDRFKENTLLFTFKLQSLIEEIGVARDLENIWIVI